MVDNPDSWASVHTITVPKQSQWQCHLISDQVVVVPNEGQEPNAFHRLMQRLVLGFRWSKRKTNNDQG